MKAGDAAAGIGGADKWASVNVREPDSPTRFQNMTGSLRRLFSRSFTAAEWATNNMGGGLSRTTSIISSLGEESDDFLIKIFGYRKAEEFGLRELNVNGSRLDLMEHIFDRDSNSAPTGFLIRFHSNTGKCIDVLRVLCSTFTFLYAFFAISFRPHYSWLYSIGVGMELAVNCIFLVTQLLLFRISYYDLHFGREYTDISAIRKILLSSPKFYFELATCLPLASIYLALLGRPDATDGFRGHPVLDIALCFMYVAPRLPIISESPPGFVMSQFDTRISIARLFCSVILISHLFGCVWHSARWYSGSAATALALAIPNEEDRTPLSWYLTNFRDGIFMISAQDRFATKNGEIFCLVLIGPIAAFFFAYIFGNTTVIVQRSLALSTEHHSHVSYILNAMNSLRLPMDLRYRITMYHEYIYAHHNTTAYDALFKGISDNLFVEVRLFLFRGLFRRAKYFNGACAGFLRQLVVALHECTVCPGDNVVVKGQIGDSMYFIIKGTSRILDGISGEEVAVLKAGAYFGEIAIVFGGKRTATVRAESYCVLGRLLRSDFDAIIANFPEERSRIVKVASGRITTVAPPFKGASTSTAMDALTEPENVCDSDRDREFDEASHMS